MDDTPRPAPPERPPAALSERLPADRPGPSGFVFRLLWAASLFVPFAIFAAAALWSWYGVNAEARARLSRTIDMLHEHALRSFETQEATLEAVDQRIRGLPFAELTASRELHEFLRAMAERAAASGGVGIVAPDGRFAAGSWEFPTRPLDVSDRDYYRVHRDREVGTYIGETVIARPGEKPVFTISRRRSAAEGRFDGVVVSSFRPGYFEDFYRSVTESRQDVVALVREDGSVLVRTPSLPDAAYSSGRDSRLLAEARRSDLLIAKGRSPFDNRERLYGFRRVGGYSVFVSYGLSSTVLRDTWLRQLAPYAIVCTLAAALLSLLTAQAQAAVRREQAALAAARSEAERRAEAEARLRHAQRIDALGQIVGGVAHDFNNVVMAVLAGTRMTRRRAEVADEVLRVVDLIEAAAERGARLTARMLAFARREEARSESVEVGQSVEAVAELLGHTLGSGYRLEVDCAQALAPARGDRAEFETVLVNLILNARDAMPDGGTIGITVREETVSEAASAPAEGLKPGHYVRVAVSDEGVGMDPETLARAGEAFFTTKAGRGTGLGVTMARAFAEEAGGALQIESEPGRGTTVTLWLATAPTSAQPSDVRRG